MKGEVLDDVALVMAQGDTVATAIDDLDARHELTVGDRTVTLSEPIEFGHKIALVDVAAGEEIVKYGEVIGRASERVSTGDWVHVHNCESTRGRGDLNAAAEGTGNGEREGERNGGETV